MKKMKIIVALLLTIGSVIGVNAQKGLTKIDIRYTAAFPTGSFKDLVSDPSFRGLDLRIMHGVTDKISVGFGTGFQDFYQKYPRRLYKLSDGSDVSAVVSNSVGLVPLLARVQYRFSPAKRIQPFVGIGLGGDMVLYRQYLGEFADSKNKFAFQAQPEAGIFFPFKAEGYAGISLSAFYNVIPFKYNETTNLNNFGFSLGISFPTRN